MGNKNRVQGQKYRVQGTGVREQGQQLGSALDIGHFEETTKIQEA